MLGRYSEDEIWSRFVFELAIWLWQDELNPRVRCAFGNVFLNISSRICERIVLNILYHWNLWAVMTIGLLNLMALHCIIMDRSLWSNVNSSKNIWELSRNYYRNKKQKSLWPKCKFHSLFLCSYFFLASKDMSRSNYLTGLSRAQLSLKGDGTMSSSYIHRF